jgi:hypothetical protein
MSNQIKLPNIPVFSILILLMLSSGLALAQQPISGNYAPGAFTGMKGALTPSKGSFMLENGTMFYNTREFVDSDGNSSGTATVNALANRTVFGYVPEWDVLGGRYLPAVIIPFANVAIRPEPGSEKEFQMGDLILQPLALGWDKGVMHYQFAYNLWLPTARFNAGASNNVGKGLFSHLLSFGATWLQEDDKPWAATLMLRYEILGKQRDTNIEPGDVFILEGGAGKEIVKGFDLGLTYYFMTQTNKEKDPSQNTEKDTYMAASLGPEINWRPNALPGLQIALRSYFEFEARNSSKGTFTVISLAYIFN